METVTGELFLELGFGAAKPFPRVILWSSSFVYITSKILRLEILRNFMNFLEGEFNHLRVWMVTPVRLSSS